MNRVLGIDIGGANLKLADTNGWAVSESFALWRDPHGLSSAVAALLGHVPRQLPLAVTMTGELSDCFADKAEGVRHILESLRSVIGDRPTRVYRLDGQFVPIELARDEPYGVAAANWHALATFAARFFSDGTGLLVDVGSTTTDIVPVVLGHPKLPCPSDTQRLLHGSLLYTGVDRSPVCAVAQYLPYRGMRCPVAQELFATMRDVYTVLGDLPESLEFRGTADGRPATMANSVRRLGRCLCADSNEFTADDACQLATAAASTQAAAIRHAVTQVSDSCHRKGSSRRMVHEVVVSGQGAFVARRVTQSLLPQRHLIDLTNELGHAQAIAAPAFAVAILAAERGAL